MWLGVDYYPEQWDSSVMEEDMDNIIELGGNVIRIGEFSWHLLEKEEGKFDFSFFDHVIKTAKRKGLHVIMGTPTAAIPAWLAAKYPDILAENENGKKRTFGSRHVVCYNSPALYEYSERILEELALHYRDEEAIAAWQIDNEIGHEGSDVCYCAQCQAVFRDYLEDKFQGDIEKLNEAYGAAFWSQEYNSFDEIPIPAASTAAHNPSLRLDWERFRSKTIEDFMNFQIDLIKSIAPEAVVIHDFPGGGLSKHVDYSKVAENLDVAAYNNYPVWGEQKKPLPANETAFSLDYIRGLKRRNFWITEELIGAQGHDITGYLPRPNQAKLWSYQGMARGCDSMMYFRYRSAVKGAEQFCYGILDSDNVKRRKYQEVQSFFKDIRQYEEALEAPIHSAAAIVYDYDSLASFRIQRQSVVQDCEKEMKKFHKIFYDKNAMIDIIPAQADFSGYRLLILPQMIVTDDNFQNRVEEFVSGGGTVVLTYRTAVKNRDNNLIFRALLPAGYSGFAGVYVEETESLQEEDAFPVNGTGDYRGEKGRGGVFRDLLVSVDADILYSYGDDFYTEYAAVTKKEYGYGMIYYLGCSLDEDTLKKIFDEIMDFAQIEGISAKEGIEIVRRGRKGGQRVRVIMNHNAYPVWVGSDELGPYGCRVETDEEEDEDGPDVRIEE